MSENGRLKEKVAYHFEMVYFACFKVGKMPFRIIDLQ